MVNAIPFLLCKVCAINYNASADFRLSLLIEKWHQVFPSVLDCQSIVSGLQAWLYGEHAASVEYPGARKLPHLRDVACARVP
jgi:hypothetical protein